MNKAVFVAVVVFALAAGVYGKKRFDLGISSKSRLVGVGADSAQLADLGRVPDFRLQDDLGRDISWSDFKGRPVLINSWAAWCPFCRQELKDLAAVQKEFGAKIVVIAVDRAEAPETAREFTNKIGVSGDLIFLLDPKDSFYQAIGGFSMPETIFVDQEGRIRIHKRGPMRLEELREKINTLLTG